MTNGFLFVFYINSLILSFQNRHLFINQNGERCLSLFFSYWSDSLSGKFQKLLSLVYNTNNLIEGVSGEGPEGFAMTLITY